MYEVVAASAADLARWKADWRTPMFEPTPLRNFGKLAEIPKPQIAAAAPVTAIPAEPPALAEPSNVDPMWEWGARFRTPGMRAPDSGYRNIPAVPGSASSIGDSHMGCGAQKGPWND